MAKEEGVLLSIKLFENLEDELLKIPEEDLDVEEEILNGEEKAIQEPLPEKFMRLLAYHDILDTQLSILDFDYKEKCEQLNTFDPNSNSELLKQFHYLSDFARKVEIFEDLLWMSIRFEFGINCPESLSVRKGRILVKIDLDSELDEFESNMIPTMDPYFGEKWTVH